MCLCQYSLHVVKLINCCCEIIGDLTKKESGEIVFGPIVIYSPAYTLMLIDKPVGMFNKEKMEYFK